MIIHLLRFFLFLSSVDRDYIIDRDYIKGIMSVTASDRAAARSSGSSAARAVRLHYDYSTGIWWMGALRWRCSTPYSPSSRRFSRPSTRSRTTGLANGGLQCQAFRWPISFFDAMKGNGGLQCQGGKAPIHQITRCCSRGAHPSRVRGVELLRHSTDLKKTKKKKRWDISLVGACQTAAVRRPSSRSYIIFD